MIESGSIKDSDRFFLKRTRQIFERISTFFGEYIIENKATVRKAAKKFGVSKSTVHKDVTEKLRHEDRELYNAVKKVLERNKSERHLRGGEATKQKYLAEKSAG